MFVSESAICRAPLAAAAFRQLLEGSPLADWIQVDVRVSEWGMQREGETDRERGGEARRGHR